MGQFRHHHSEKQGQWLCFGSVRRITLNVTCSNVTCYVLCSRKSFNTVNTLIILLFSKKWDPGFAAEDNKYIN